jgi:carboxypeptidase family protein
MRSSSMRKNSRDRTIRRGMTVVIGLLAALSSYASPALGEEARLLPAEEDVVLSVRFVTPDGAVTPADGASVHLQAIFYATLKNGLPVGLGRVPAKQTRVHGKEMSVTIPSPYARLAKAGLSSEEVARLSCFLKLAPSSAFPYTSGSGVSIGLLQAKDRRLDMPVTRVPKTAKVIQVRVISGATKKPVPDLWIYAGGEDHITRNDGGVSVVVNDPSKELAILSTELNHGIERVDRVKVSAKQIAEAIRQKIPVTVMTRVPKLVGTLVLSDPEGDPEGGQEEVKADGSVSLRHSLGPKRTTSRTLRLRAGVFYLFDEKRSSAKPGQSGTVAILYGAAGKKYIVKPGVRYVLPKEGIARVTVPVLVRQDRAVQVQVTDSVTGKPIAGAQVRLIGKDDATKHLSNPAVTLESGSVTIKKVLMGRYRAQASARGYEAARREINVLGAGGVALRLRPTCDVTVVISAKDARERTLKLRPVEEALQFSYFGRLAPGARRVVVRNVPQGKATLLVRAEQGALRVYEVIQPVDIAAGQDSLKVNVQCVPALVKVKIGYLPEKSVRIRILDKETMWQVVRMKGGRVGSTLSVSLPRRRYLVFAAVPRRRWIHLGELDLRQAVADKVTRKEFVGPQKADEADLLDPGRIIGHRGWRKMSKPTQ